MKLLFEYPSADYFAEIDTDRSHIKKEIERHLCNAGVRSPTVYVLSYNKTAVKGERRTNRFYLQRYNKIWDRFLNLDTLEDVSTGDRLTVAAIHDDDRLRGHGGSQPKATDQAGGKKNESDNVRMHYTMMQTVS